MESGEPEPVDACLPAYSVVQCGYTVPDCRCGWLVQLFVRTQFGPPMGRRHSGGRSREQGPTDVMPWWEEWAKPRHPANGSHIQELISTDCRSRQGTRSTVVSSRENSMSSHEILPIFSYFST